MLIARLFLVPISVLLSFFHRMCLLVYILVVLFGFCFVSFLSACAFHRCTTTEQSPMHKDIDANGPLCAWLVIYFYYACCKFPNRDSGGIMSLEGGLRRPVGRRTAPQVHSSYNLLWQHGCPRERRLLEAECAPPRRWSRFGNNDVL